MVGKTFIEITQNPINTSAAINFVCDPAHGGLVTFWGMVRNFNAGKEVVAVSYDVADTLAINAIKTLCDEVHVTWGRQLKLYVVHFKGRLEIGGISVAIATSSPHREEAFESCRFLIDEIKHRVPIWKKEFYTSGESDWVKGHALCARN